MCSSSTGDLRTARREQTFDPEAFHQCSGDAGYRNGRVVPCRLPLQDRTDPGYPVYTRTFEANSYPGLTRRAQYAITGIRLRKSTIGADDACANQPAPGAGKGETLPE